ncbi:MAG: uroporphyrinogen-III C-methyltransferase [Flavobacteriales bacterium]|nr:uroporphyrinogen-III C-methyltransferase [Flavobacteriales bacterium]MCB9364296.1 uroporphyrinogen-III C-methyltransferase [Flavobacteriales bacterium]
MNTKVTLVGAGPGDPELLTLKAINAIKNADAILYDALINKAVLKYAKPSAILMCVGKRVGKHSFKQEEINKLIIDHAFNYGNVVRLKGGDPFIFGRGYEELEYVESFGMKVEVVPGISSSFAVPASQKIPVTHRGVSQSFWVLTATNKNGDLSDDIKLAVQTNTTVVILMGVNKLSEIVKMYKNQNKGDVPVGIIQNGTLKSEKAIYGTLNTIEQQKSKANIQAPAIIIIGEVVALKQEVLIDEISNLNYYGN